MLAQRLFSVSTPAGFMAEIGSGEVTDCLKVSVV